MQFTFVVGAFLALALVFSAKASSPDPTSLLEEADIVRTSDFAAFEQLMTRIESLHAKNNNFTLSQQQKYFFQFLKGYQNTFNGKIDEAISVYKNLESSSANNTLKLRAISSLVNNYAIKRDFLAGAKAINRLFEYREKVADDETVNGSFVVAGIFYNQALQFELGLSVANQLLQRELEGRHECFARQLKIEAELGLTELLSDYDYALDSIKFCESANEQLVANIIRTFVAESMITENRIEESLILLNEAEQKTLEIRYQPLIGMHYSLTAKNHLLLGQYELAEQYGEKALEAINNFGFTKALVKALEIMYQSAEQQQQFEKALNLLERFSEAEKAYLDDVKARGLAVQQAKYEVLEQANKIALLDKQNALLKSQTELALKQTQNERLALALAISLLIILFVWLYRSKKIQRKLRKLAETDELTGISNRHYFNSRARQHIKQARMQKQPISFVLFDLDHFKKVNDTFGHQTGDWALKKSVLEAKLLCRSIDLIGRMGGEEFAILLPGCEIDEALKVAEICRNAIENIDTVESDHDFKITASFGVTDTTISGYTLEKLFAGADAALYYSKENGRNQVYRFNSKQMVLEN